MFRNTFYTLILHDQCTWDLRPLVYIKETMFIIRSHLKQQTDGLLILNKVLGKDKQ